jgi:2-polyprenyl-3-methyl-5-hydroxy-6-metoxy-1,4-benzoquinol methylase
MTMNEFDLKAELWDMDPIHLARTKSIASQILQHIPLRKEMTVLEYGAGTGMLSLMLSKQVGRIVLMDSSEGMIRVARDKIARIGLTNMEPVLLDLEKESYDAEFDLIATQMVLHHVENVDNMFRKFHGLLKPGGFLAIADLYPEDGSFHGEGFTGHKGFDPLDLSRKTAAAGFINIQFRECFIIKREQTENRTAEYPLFLLTAGK